MNINNEIFQFNKTSNLNILKYKKTRRLKNKIFKEILLHLNTQKINSIIT